jgi:hypothetical protein
MHATAGSGPGSGPLCSRPAGKSTARQELRRQALRGSAGSSAAHRSASWSSGTPSSLHSVTTVKNAGVGTRPVSILRRVSGDIPTAVATEVMLRGPRAARRTSPSRRPRSWSCGVKGTRTMTVILIPG